MTDRRRFLGTLLAASAMPRLSWADAGSPAFLAAARERNGAYALFGLTARGEDLFRVPLPGRGHAGAAHPERPEAVVFARRPGTYALVLSCVGGHVRHRLAAPEGRAFNGHGAFSLGGDRLYTSEVIAETGEGRIGLWDRNAGYRRVGDIPSHGIGPHEIRRMPGSELLVVANGGIHTQPGGREKLNIPTMAPNLSYVAPDGTLRQQIAPAHHMQSIRHVSISATGLVAFAMQWQGDLLETPPLLGLHRLGDAAPVWAQAGERHFAMKGYVGSVSFFARDSRVAISSPWGGRVQIFDAKGRYLEELRRTDVCGLAAEGRALVVTDGLGTFATVEHGRFTGHTKAPRSWDHHIVPL
ncbi:DUF1513 domain-containing protein [Acidimangrovimonas pyrenivorans]|uniref:DUF1513 domain-containing protein n=1 Tax=Acidimangrovimonas pyrenivorans TaxID=2030798 RepID=A0ABV7AKR0_9RHOB